MIVTKIIATPIGDMVAGSTEAGICLLEFTDRRMLNTEYRILRKYLKDDICEGETIHTENLTGELCEYFEGKRKTFSVPLVFTGTDFQKSVWDELLRIPFGLGRYSSGWWREHGCLYGWHRPDGSNGCDV